MGLSEAIVRFKPTYTYASPKANRANRIPNAKHMRAQPKYSNEAVSHPPSCRHLGTPNGPPTLPCCRRTSQLECFLIHVPDLPQNVQCTLWQRAIAQPWSLSNRRYSLTFGAILTEHCRRVSSALCEWRDRYAWHGRKPCPAAKDGNALVLCELTSQGYVLEKDEQLSPLQKVEGEALTSLVVEKLFKCQVLQLTFKALLTKALRSLDRGWKLRNLHKTQLLASRLFSATMVVRQREKEEHARVPKVEWIWRYREGKRSLAPRSYFRIGQKDSQRNLRSTLRQAWRWALLFWWSVWKPCRFISRFSPTTFDCIAFGFLQTQACKDIPKSHIQEFLFAHKNLVDFCNR